MSKYPGKFPTRPDSSRNNRGNKRRLTAANNDTASPKEKESLLECLYQVAAADGLVSTAEDEEIKQIGAALMIPHSRVIEVRSKYSDKLEILQGLPS